jgi:hypothetical protein
MTITFDKKKPIYRCKDFLKFTVKLSPKAPTKKTDVLIKVGYCVSLQGSMNVFSMDFIVREEKIEVPSLKVGETFNHDFKIQLPKALPTYLGYNGNLKWAIETKINRITKSSGINKYSIAYFTLLPKKKYTPSPKDISIITDLRAAKDIRQKESFFKGLFKIKENVKNFTKTRYEEQLKYYLLKGSTTLFASIVFGAFFLGAFFLVTTGLISGQFLPLKEDAPIDGFFEWFIMYLLLSLPIILTSILTLVPLIFSLFFWRISQDVLTPLFIKRLLGSIELSDLNKITLGEIHKGNISFEPTKPIKVESLRILLIQQELGIIHNGQEKSQTSNIFIRKTINSHTISEVELYKKSNFSISKNQKINYPFKFKINENAPGTWSICFKKKQSLTFLEHEFSHRWLIRLEFKRFNKKPFYREFPLLISSTENYNPTVSEPSSHY